MLPIPAYPSGQKATRCTCWVLSIERSLDTPIVRYIELPPVAVVRKSPSRRPQVTQTKAPIRIELNATTTLSTDLRRQQATQSAPNKKTTCLNRKVKLWSIIRAFNRLTPREIFPTQGGPLQPPNEKTNYRSATPTRVFENHQRRFGGPRPAAVTFNNRTGLSLQERLHGLLYRSIIIGFTATRFCRRQPARHSMTVASSE